MVLVISGGTPTDNLATPAGLIANHRVYTGLSLAGLKHHPR